MRHKLSGRQLSRNSSHRHAMLRNMAASLLRHETIRTTLPKAKELRRVVEPLDHVGKGRYRRRIVAWRFARLRDSDVVTKLFDDLEVLASKRVRKRLHAHPAYDASPRGCGTDGTDATGGWADDAKSNRKGDGKGAKAASKGLKYSEEKGKSAGKSAPPDATDEAVHGPKSRPRKKKAAAA